MIVVKNGSVVITHQTAHKNSMQSTTSVRQILRILFRISIRAGLATVFVFWAKGSLSAENQFSEFYYYYQDKKDIIHYTNKPNSEKYSLLYGKQSIDRLHDVAEKAVEGKDIQVVCRRNEDEITLKLIPPGFPIKQTITASVQRNTIFGPTDGKNQEKINTNEGVNKNSTNIKEMGEKKMPEAMSQEISKNEMILAAKKPAQLPISKTKQLGNGIKQPQNSFGLKGKIDQFIMEAAREYWLSPSLLKAIIRAESNFNPRAVSTQGAIGLMQIMPNNFSLLNIEDPFDLRQNIMGGASYLRQMLDYFKLDLVKAIAAYNAGPAIVEKANGIPNIKETRLYVKKVLGYMAQYDER